MKRNNKSIFKKLIISYIVFTLIAIFGSIAFFTVALIQTGNEKEYTGDLPYVTFEADGSIDNTDNIIKIGGWIEELNDKNEVIQVIGKKQTKSMSYQPEELLTLVSKALDQGSRQMTVTEDGTNDYYSFFHDAGEKRYLIYYPADRFQIVYSLKHDELVYTSFDKGILLVVLLFLVFEVIGVSIFVSKKITNPLNDMSEGMMRIAAGDEKIHIKLHDEKEFAGIQTAFQNMVHELDKQKREKEELLKRRHQLLLELSHDIKTPVSTIKSYALALSNHMVPEEDMEKYYVTIAKKADRVNQLTVDLFTFLKMESDDYQIERERINFTELLRSILAEYYDEISEAGYHLEMDFGNEDFYMEGDEKLLVRVVENLILNAIKYNVTGNLIQVKLMQQAAENKLLLRIMDDGDEIEKNIQDTMFFAFVRGEKARRTDGGTGLGLAISKQIVDKHHGQMMYCYEAGMNCFDVLFPL